MEKQWTLKDLKREIKRLDPKLSPQEDAFKSALILLSALIVGADRKALVAFTGYSNEFMAIREKRLRKNGVWKKEKTAADWFSKDGGGVAFWLDVLIAEGMMKRAGRART